MFHTYTSGMMTNSSSESSVKSPPAKTDLPLKGDTVIENDVWIGQNSVILSGVHIGDGAIIGASNQLIVCPNHHSIIHDTNPVFDRRRLLYICCYGK
ncbi:DapH/DapD/GlmU-related protein [Blautia wexlerae]|uniref:DapH/DapD/GlmU-related protein n=1 Tax=Blautia wexlerae TaxID=418240 RepID=UPI002FE6D4B1